MGAKLNFKEAKKELDRRIEESKISLNNAQCDIARGFETEMGLSTEFFKGQLKALIELRYSIQGGEQPPKEK
jgi:hypothetical protein